MNVVLVLDVDGVLVDPTRDDGRSWLHDSAEHFGLDIDQLHGFFAWGWEPIVLGEEDLHERLDAYFTESGITVDCHEFVEHWLNGDFKLNDTLIGLAGHWAAQGVPVFLGTNQEHTRAAFLMQQLTTFPIVDILYSAKLRAAKPSADFFARASERIAELHPSARVVFVDDAEKNVEAARAHGWTAIHYQGQATIDDELAAAISGAGRTIRG